MSPWRMVRSEEISHKRLYLGCNQQYKIYGVKPLSINATCWKTGVRWQLCSNSKFYSTPAMFAPVNPASSALSATIRLDRPPGCSRHGSKHATCAMWRKSVHQLHEPKHFHNVSEEATTGQVHSLNKELSKPPRPWKLWKRQKVVLSSWKTEPLDWDTLCGLHWECWRLRDWLTPCPIDMSYLHRCHIHLAGICLLHSSNTLQQGQQTKTMTALLPSRETECMGTLESLETKLQHIYIYMHLGSAWLSNYSPMYRLHASSATHDPPPSNNKLHGNNDKYITTANFL